MVGDSGDAVDRWLSMSILRQKVLTMHSMHKCLLHQVVFSRVSESQGMLYQDGVTISSV